MTGGCAMMSFVMKAAQSARAQPDADIGVLPAVKIVALVESADLEQRRPFDARIARAEECAREVLRSGRGKRALVGDVDDGSGDDRVRPGTARAQVRFDEMRRRERVVVAEDHDGTRRRGDPGIASFAAVWIGDEKGTDRFSALLRRFDDPRRPVRRAVVDDQHFERARRGLSRKAPEACFESIGAVTRRDDDGCIGHVRGRP